MRTSVQFIALFYGAIAVAFVFEVANAGCPFKNIGRRSLLQAPTAAPAPSVVPDTYLAPPLQYGFYDQSCPGLRELVKDKIAAYTLSDAITPAPLLRLFFHDCFTQGCDGSLLLNSTVLNLAEKDQAKSLTLDRFYIIDDIKQTLESGMCNNTVSCADILALTAVTRPQVPAPVSRSTCWGRLPRHMPSRPRGCAASRWPAPPSDHFQPRYKHGTSAERRGLASRSE